MTEPAPRRKRTLSSRERAVAAIAVSLLAIVATAAIVSSVKGHAGQPASAATATASDGDFAFTVEDETCGAAAIRAVDPGGMGYAVPPGATVCVFTIRVTDDKATAQTFWDAAQFAFDTAGRRFSADLDGAAFLRGDENGAQVNPGITITAEVPFQVPAGDRIARLVLHDSVASAGVTVRV